MFCALQAGAADCETLAVVGAGPVGLMTALCALHLGADQVFVLDSVAERLELAARFGASPLSIVDGAADKELLAITDGRGVDAVCECVGSPAASRASIDILRAGGTLSAVGVHTEDSFAFSPGEAYDKNLTYRAGRCPARALMDTTLPLALDSTWPLEELFTHRVPLEYGAEAYRIFGAREEGCIKVLLELG
jgi:threonine dehydrogenase-like Zn-dependent dehydrogenase